MRLIMPKDTVACKGIDSMLEKIAVRFLPEAEI